VSASSHHLAVVNRLAPPLLLAVAAAVGLGVRADAGIVRETRAQACERNAVDATRRMAAARRWAAEVREARRRGLPAPAPDLPAAVDGAPPTVPGWYWSGDPAVSVDEKTGTTYFYGPVEANPGAHGVGLVSADAGTRQVPEPPGSSRTPHWGSPVLARSANSALVILDTPRLVADSTTGHLYLVCRAFDGASGAGIEVQRSSDGGATWSAPARISSVADRGAVLPASAAVGTAGELVVTWPAIGRGDDDHLRVRTSTTGGASWGPELTAATIHLDDASGAAAIAVDRTTGVDRGRIHLAWAGSVVRDAGLVAPTDSTVSVRSHRAVFATWSRDGATWSEPAMIDTAHASAARRPHLSVAADGMPYLTWLDGPHAYTARSADGGATWSTSRRRAGDITRIATGLDLGVCQGDLGVDPGTALSPRWTVVDRNPLFADELRWTLTSERGWPLPGPGAVSTPPGGSAEIRPVMAVPDSAAPGSQRICLTVTDARGARSRECCFTVTVQRAPASVPILASAFDLRAGAPDPATRRTRIDFSVPDGGPVQVRIYDLRGGLIRTLTDGARSAGPYSVTWDGRNDHGDPAGAGAYFCRLEGLGSVKVQRLIWLR
jgi:hypothetical protein